MNPKQKVARLFDLVAEGYDSPMLRFFPMVGDQMADLLKLKPGERVLDIATGTGAFATAAAQAVRPGGRVQAIDLSEGMLAKAQKNVEKMALDNVDFHCMDAAEPEFRSNYFDAVACSFGIFFFSDMDAALRSWLRLLKPGGRIMFTSFSSSAFQPMTDLFFSDLRSVGLELPENQPRTASDRLPDAAACEQLLTGAGFADVASLTLQKGFHIARAEDWWEVVWNAGLRSYVEQLQPEQLVAFRSRHISNIDALKTDDGIWLDVETFFVGGRKP